MKNLFKLHIDNLARTPQPVNLAKTDTEASLYIYDMISADWGVSALSVIDALAQVGDAKTLNIHINSPGGDVFEGRAIMAALQRYEGKTVAHIDSLCASAATSIALACDDVMMSDGAFFMIHNASGMAFGDKKTMRDTADLLEKVEGSIVSDYTKKTGKPMDEIAAMMDAETWMTAQEALDHGFVDSIVEAKTKPKNAWNLAAYNNAPQELKPPDPEQETETETEPAVGFFMSNANRLKLVELSL